MSTCRHWLATPGMGVEKIAQYYNDPEKRRSDAHSLRTSVFAKRAALGEGLLWTAFRWGYYAGAQARNFLEHGELAEMPPAERALPTRSPVLKRQPFVLWAIAHDAHHRTCSPNARPARAPGSSNCATTSARRSRRWKMRCPRARRSPSARPAASCARRGSAPIIPASRAAAA